MTTKPNANCAICGKSYHKCSKCNEMAQYKAFVCSPECYQVFLIMKDFEEGVLTESDATERYAYLDITLDSDFSKYTEGVASAIKRTIENGTTTFGKQKKNKKISNLE